MVRRVRAWRFAMRRIPLVVLSAALVAVGLATGSCSSGTEEPPDIPAAMSETTIGEAWASIDGGGGVR